MSEEELKAIEKLKGYLDYNKKHKNILLDADEVIQVQETVLNLIEKQQEKIDETKEEQYFLIHKITSKIDYFDYEYKRAKRQGDNERADFYCELSKNFKKLLEE